MYFPNSTKHFGHKKVYVQQQRVLLAQKIKESVWTTFWKDFMEEVDEWLEQGDQLVIAGDWNSDVRKRNFLEKLKQRNLWPAITGMHGTEGPGTFHNGSVPIDEIFISPSLKITGCGYMEHGINIGDHRPIWIDISKSSALGSSLPPIPSFQARRLKCNDPKVVEKYSQRLEEQLRKNKVFSKLKTIFENFTVPLTEEQEFMMEELDEIREQAMLWAEKKCRKLRMGGRAWSPELQVAMDKIKYIKLTISKKKGRRVGARLMIRLSRKLGMNKNSMAIPNLVKELNIVYEEYKELKGKDRELRNSYLEQLAETMEQYGEGNKAGYLRQLIIAEENKEMYRKIARVTKKVENMGTTFVTIKDENGRKKDVIEKDQMEEEIINENRKKFHQTEGTCPFLQPMLKKDFGDYGEGEATNQVLKGEYKIPEGLDEYTRDFLEVCKLSEVDKKASFYRTPDQFKKSWKK